MTRCAELRVEPLPADVLARLDGRLEGELGRPAPVRRRRRSRRFLAIPGVAVTAVAAVVVVVLVTNGSGSQPGTESAASLKREGSLAELPRARRRRSRAPQSGAATDSSALARVPVLTGRTLARAASVAGAHGLHVKLIAKPCPSTEPDRVLHQQPRAGAKVAPGATIRVSLC